MTQTSFGDATRVGLAGDWHGNTMWARHAIYSARYWGVEHVHHLGDFGLFWPGGWNQYFNEVQGACTRYDVNLYITPGNHENWDAINAEPIAEDGMIHLSERIKILPRGFRWTQGGRTFVSLGGAPSIDRHMRSEGRSWWRAEAITPQDVEKVAEGGHADIMLAHDAPNDGTLQVQRIIDTPASQSGWPKAELTYCAQCRQLMDAAFNAVMPRVFAHGHYHVKDERYHTGRQCQFLSLDCDGSGLGSNLVALDLEDDDLPHQWLMLMQIPRKK